MALSAEQVTTCETLQAARTVETPVIWAMQQDLAEAAKLLVPRSVAHNRTKVIWRFGEKVTIFLSKDDNSRVNGFYFSWQGVEPVDLLRGTSGVNQFVGVIGCQYLYQFDFGDNDANSERNFVESVSTFLVGLDTLKEIQSNRFLGYSADMLLTESAGQPVHYFNGRLRFRICAL